MSLTYFKVHMSYVFNKYYLPIFNGFCCHRSCAYHCCWINLPLYCTLAFQCRHSIFFFIIDFYKADDNQSDEHFYFILNSIDNKLFTLLNQITSQRKKRYSLDGSYKKLCERYTWYLVFYLHVYS